LMVGGAALVASSLAVRCDRLVPGTYFGPVVVGPFLASPATLPARVTLVRSQAGKQAGPDTRRLREATAWHALCA